MTRNEKKKSGVLTLRGLAGHPTLVDDAYAATHGRIPTRELQRPHSTLATSHHGCCREPQHSCSRRGSGSSPVGHFSGVGLMSNDDPRRRDGSHRSALWTCVVGADTPCTPGFFSRAHTQGESAAAARALACFMRTTALPFSLSSNESERKGRENTKI